MSDGEGRIAILENSGGIFSISTGHYADDTEDGNEFNFDGGESYWSWEHPNIIAWAHESDLALQAQAEIST